MPPVFDIDSFQNDFCTGFFFAQTTFWMKYFLTIESVLRKIYYFSGSGMVLRGRNVQRNADLNKRLEVGAKTSLDALFEKKTEI